MERLSPVGWALRPLKNYAKFTGRASRAEFWWFFLLVMLIYFAAVIVLAVAGGAAGAMNPGSALVAGSLGVAFIFIALFWLALFVPVLAVQFRRLHDTDRSGWWIGGFWLLYIAYLVSTAGMAMSGFAASGSSPPLASFAVVEVMALAVFAYSLLLLVFFCLPGTSGSNRYGNDPYGQDIEEVFA